MFDFVLYGNHFSTRLTEVLFIKVVGYKLTQIYPYLYKTIYYIDFIDRRNKFNKTVHMKHAAIWNGK